MAYCCRSVTERGGHVCNVAGKKRSDMHVTDHYKFSALIYHLRSRGNVQANALHL